MSDTPAPVADRVTDCPAIGLPVASRTLIVTMLLLEPVEAGIVSGAASTELFDRAGGARQSRWR